jgi:hypothetical protein
MAIRRVKPRTAGPKQKLRLKDVLGPRQTRPKPKENKRNSPVDKPKKKKLPHEKLLDKYLKGDIPFTIPAGTKKLKDKLRDLLKKKRNPIAKTGPRKVKPGGPYDPTKPKKIVPGGPYKPKKGPKYMKPMKSRKK